VLWAAALKQLRSTEIVINCAGRTRSIVGAATLKRLGVPNVRALRNGTMGWLLAGLELEKNPAPIMPQPSADSAARARELAQEIAREEKIARMPAARLQALQDSGDGALYLVDVRSENEYRAGHLSGSISVPGGQAVQRADDFIAVRNGQIVFISNESARAVLAAYWYRQMGFPNVSVLDRGIAGWRESGRQSHSGSVRQEPYGYQAARNVAQFVEAHELQREMRRSAVLVLDIGTSADFESAHIPGARWIPRGWLELEIPKNFPERGRTIVVACGDETSSVFAARTLSELGYADVRVLSGGVEEWTAAGYPVEKGLEGALVEVHDVVLSPSIRGDRDEMQRYLEWELNLTRS
jgi:rhodanese-related sulfurtransferase